MGKPLRLTVILFLILGFLSACGNNSGNDEGEEKAGASSSNKQTLKIGTEGTYKPFSFKNLETGELTGYDVAVAREVAKRIGMEAEFVTTPWKGMIGALESKRFDMIANQVGINEKRKNNYAFSNPYTYSGARVIVNKDNTSIHGFDDLKGKVVGTTKGSNYAAYAKEAGAKLKYYKGIDQVLKDVGSGRIDAGLNDRLFILTQLDAKKKLKAVGEAAHSTKMAFMFRQKGSQELIQKVNKALKEMKKDGTIAEISEKWFGANVSEPE